MENNSSYRVSEVAGSVDQEVLRLKGQVDLFWDKENKRYQDFGLRDNMKVVELGSGPGFLVEKVLEHYPNSQLTGVEIDSFLCEYAKSHLYENYPERVQIVEGSILDIPFPDNSFDFAITRLVIEHLSDPVAAIKEVKRILKPNGKCVFIDNDFEMHIMASPHTAHLRNLYDAYCACRQSEGGNPTIGRELPWLLQEAGLKNIDFDVISAHNFIVGDEKFFKSEGIGIPTKLVKSGFLESKMMGKISVEWSKMIKEERHSILRQLYIAVGEK